CAAALYPGRELRHLVSIEETTCSADFSSQQRRLCSKAVPSETESDQAVVVRPYRAVLIRIGIKREVVGRERADPPSAAHVWCHQSRNHAGRPFSGHYAGPQAMTGVGCD